MTVILLIFAIILLVCFIIFTKQCRQTVVLDLSALTDCRITEFINCNLFDSVLIPEFVINALEKKKNFKICVEKLKQNKRVSIIGKDYGFLRNENLKIIKLAHLKKAKIVTANFELNRMAHIRGIKVINLNDIYESLKPVILPGYKIKVFLVREGKEQNQAVGYLEDGSTVVVENAKKFIGSRNSVIVTSIMQSSTNKIVFAKIEE